MSELEKYTLLSNTRSRRRNLDLTSLRHVK